MRDIMDSCSETIGKKLGEQSAAKKELAELSEEKSRTDDAMERLAQLYKIFVEQFALEEQSDCSDGEGKVRSKRRILGRKR